MASFKLSDSKMLDFKELAGAAVAGVVVLYTLSHLNTALRRYRAAKKAGCKPPVPVFAADSSGFRIVNEVAKAMDEKAFPQWVLKQFHLTSEEQGREVNTMTFSIPLFDKSIVTRDPENIQAVLATQFADFGLGPNRCNGFKPLLGNGIFATDGKPWEHSRALLRPSFARSQISDLELEERHVSSLMKALESHLGKDNGWTGKVDLLPLFFNLTLDSSTEFLFGESAGTQVAALTGTSNNTFADDFNESQLVLALASRLGPYYWTMHNAAFRRSVKRTHEYVDKFVNIALQSDGSSKGKTGDGKEKYVFLEELAQRTRDPEELRSQLLNILLAGRDTTASTMGWFFYLMALDENRETYNKLRTIILETFGTYTNPKDITFESLKNCRYLQWCLNETLRIYPVVPYNGRAALRDTTLPTGGGPDGKSPIFVKKGQSVEYSVIAMHLRTSLWGEDAASFRPERWEGRRPGWDYLPFNGGPRICIGQQFALTSLGYWIVRLMQRIDRIDGSEVGDVKYDASLTICPGAGVNVKVHFVDAE